MKYQYKIIGYLEQKLFYKFEADYPYTFAVGDEVWFPETWKKEQGGEYTWKIRKVQHYPVDHFIAVYVIKLV